MALYLAKKNALKAAIQKGGVDKDKSAKKGPGKSPQPVKKVKKGGTPVKEVKVCLQLGYQLNYLGFKCSMIT